MRVVRSHKVRGDFGRRSPLPESSCQRRPWLLVRWDAGGCMPSPWDLHMLKYALGMLKQYICNATLPGRPRDMPGGLTAGEPFSRRSFRSAATIRDGGADAGGPAPDQALSSLPCFRRSAARTRRARSSRCATTGATASVRAYRKPGAQGQLVCRYLFARADNEPAPWSSEGGGPQPDLAACIR